MDILNLVIVWKPIKKVETYFILVEIIIKCDSKIFSLGLRICLKYQSLLFLLYMALKKFLIQLLCILKGFSLIKVFNTCEVVREY